MKCSSHSVPPAPLKPPPLPKRLRLDNKEKGLWAGFTSFNFFLFSSGVKVQDGDLTIPIYNGVKAGDPKTHGEDGTWEIRSQRSLFPAFQPHWIFFIAEPALMRELLLLLPLPPLLRDKAVSGCRQPPKTPERKKWPLSPAPLLSLSITSYHGSGSLSQMLLRPTPLSPLRRPRSAK